MSVTPEIQLAPCAKVEKRKLLESISSLPPFRFVLVMSIIFVFSLFLHLLIWHFLSDHFRLSLKEDPITQFRERFGWLGLFLMAVVVIPWIETGLGQALPMVLTRFLPRPTIVYLFLATVWFSYLHAMDQQGSWFWIMIFSHVVGSFIFACTFLHGWKHSWWRGIWMTSVVHTVGNLSLFIYSYWF